jgi:hypothetical protein
VWEFSPYSGGVGLWGEVGLLNVRVDDTNNTLVFINTARSSVDDRTTWRWYLVPDSASYRPNFGVDVRFKDGTGREMSWEKLQFQGPLCGSGFGLTRQEYSYIFDKRLGGPYNVVVLTPYYLDSGGHYIRSATITLEAEFAVSDLDRLSEITCSVTP